MGYDSGRSEADAEYYCGADFEEVLNKYSDYIKNETLALNIIPKELQAEEISVNGIKVFVEIEKNN